MCKSMDYEKAYKDALERARKFYNDCVKGDNPIQAQRYVDIFPELNEHPDPRHSLIEFIKWSCDRGCITPEQKKNVDFWLAYLEKQKEQKPLSTEESELNSIAFLEQMGYTCIPPKEHKPILEVFGFKVGDAVRLKDGDGRKHIIKSFEKVKGIHGPDFYQVEFEDNSAVGGIYPGKKYPNGYYTHMEKFEEEQKPVSGSSEKPNYHAEWSEEDEKMLKWLCRIVHSQRVTKVITLKEESELGEWMDKWLNHNPQPHWKPSEEEMEALKKVAFSLVGTGTETDVWLVTLYNALKELIKYIDADKLN